MFLSNCYGSFSESQIIQSTSTCPTHNEHYLFICMNKQQPCKSSPLICNGCLAQHKGHPFQSIEQYFGPDLQVVLKTGTSMNGYAVNRLNQHVMKDLQKMRGRITRQIDSLQQTLRSQLSKLIPKYPLNNKFNIPGKQINPNNIKQLIQISNRQKNHIWVPAAQKYIRSLLGQVTSMIANLINDVNQHVARKQYEIFTQVDSEKLIDQFVSKYLLPDVGKYKPDRHYFNFSIHDKHDNIRVYEQGMIAKYIHNIFDAALIVIGVCVPHTAKIFGYRQLIQPSHGSYMIGSNGRCYHATNQKYIKKSKSFGFGEGDCLAIGVDFQKNEVWFRKKGIFKNLFVMELGVKEEDLFRLRACVMFHGEIGAMVQIISKQMYETNEDDNQHAI